MLAQQAIRVTYDIRLKTRAIVEELGGHAIFRAIRASGAGVAKVIAWQPPETLTWEDVHEC